MSLKSIRLSNQHQWWIYGSFGVLFVSGLAWIIFHFLLAAPQQFNAEHSTLEPTALMIHGGAAMVFLVVFGSLIPGHMKTGWRIRMNYRTGVSMSVIALLLTLSGYGLYYIGDDSFRSATSWAHVIAGLLIVPLLAWHVYKRPR